MSSLSIVEKSVCTVNCTKTLSWFWFGFPSGFTACVTSTYSGLAYIFPLYARKKI